MGTKRKKDLEQEHIRQLRKEAQRKQKLIAQEPSLSREIGKAKPKRRILIISEGEKTEVSYFGKFKHPNLTIKTMGLGLGTCVLVREAFIKAEELERQGKKFDEKWVVFDKDDHEDFCDAIKLAEDAGWKVAYSNQAVEYWFILHFRDLQGAPLDRKEYAAIINEELGRRAYYDCPVLKKRYSDLGQK